MNNWFAQEFKNNHIKLILLILLLGCAFCQLAATFYFTVFEAVEHMGIDSSWEYLKVLIADRENSLFPVEAVHGTTHSEFERLLLALPLYKLTGNLYISYGLTNALVTALNIYLIVKISKCLNHSNVNSLLIVNLFLCPFLSNGYTVQNELGYYECVSGFAAYYNVLITTFLLTLYFFVLDIDEKKQKIVGFVTIISTIYISFCKGLGILMWIGAPIVVYIAAEIFVQNSFLVIKKRKNIFLISFIVSMFVGRMLGSLYGLSYFDGETRWVTVPEFFKVLGNTIIGFAYLLGGAPAPGALRSPTSFVGFVYCFGLVISVCFYTAIIYTTITIIKRIKADVNAGIKSVNIIEKHENVLFLLTIIGMTIVIFSLISPYMIIGDVPNERYLIFAALAGFFLLGSFIESIDSKLLLKKIGITLLFVSIVAMNLYSIYFLKITDNSSLKVNELLDVVNQYDANLIYFWDNGKTLVEPEKIIRVLDSNRVYKCISNGDELETFGDYNYYENSNEYKGPTMLILLGDDKAAPDEIINKYDYITDVGKYSVYYSNANPIDLEKCIR